MKQVEDGDTGSLAGPNMYTMGAPGKTQANA